MAWAWRLGRAVIIVRKSSRRLSLRRSERISSHVADATATALSPVKLADRRALLFVQRHELVAGSRVSACPDRAGGQRKSWAA